MKNRNKILILLCSILSVPIICNLVIGSKNFTPISVVGDDKDWLGFYGSYIGSVIAALTSFYLLLKELEITKSNLQKEHQYRDITKTIEDLADRFSKYYPAEIIEFSIIQDISTNSIEKEIDRLKLLHGKYRAMGYSARILYGNENADSPCGQFFKSYMQLINETSKLICDIIIVMSNASSIDEKEGLFNCKKKQAVQELKQELIKYSSKIQKLEDYNTEVLELANGYQTWMINNYRKQ